MSANDICAVPTPNACRHCGVDKETHLQRWAPDVKWHVWIEPSNEQRKERLRARRNESETSA